MREAPRVAVANANNNVIHSKHFGPYLAVLLGIVHFHFNFYFHIWSKSFENTSVFVYVTDFFIIINISDMLQLRFQPDK